VVQDDCEALAVARPQSAKFWELRAAIDLGRLWRDQGKCIEARELLMPIYEWYTEGFDVPALRDARCLPSCDDVIKRSTSRR
jgi:hypothetical protein